MTDAGLRVEASGGSWRISGPGDEAPGLVNAFLAHLADRNYSPRTVRAYAFDLLHFCRWLASEGARRYGSRLSESTAVDGAPTISATVANRSV